MIDGEIPEIAVRRTSVVDDFALVEVGTANSLTGSAVDRRELLLVGEEDLGPVARGELVACGPGPGQFAHTLRCVELYGPARGGVSQI